MPDITFQGGRLAPVPTKPRLKLAPFLTGQTPIAPNSQADWVSSVEDWPMYGNDKAGNCTIATVGHALEIATHYGQGKTVKVSDASVMAKYSALSGYDPTTGANDTGLVVQDVLNDWVKVGIEGHKALAFAQVDLSNADEVRMAIEIFGWVYLGINFPGSAMDQFNAGQPWDVVKGAKNEGGHAIPAAFYDQVRYKVITWGKVQEMSLKFFLKYTQECWVVITPEWLNAAGTSPTGVNLYGLGQQFAALTGKSNPFPKPAPQPNPPIPPSTDPDQNLWSALKAWAKLKGFS